MVYIQKCLNFSYSWLILPFMKFLSFHFPLQSLLGKEAICLLHFWTPLPKRYRYYTSFPFCFNKMSSFIQYTVSTSSILIFLLILPCLHFVLLQTLIHDITTKIWSLILWYFGLTTTISNIHIGHWSGSDECLSHLLGSFYLRNYTQPLQKPWEVWVSE